MFQQFFFFFQHVFQKIGSLLQTPILFLLMTRILMLCIWVSFLKEDGLFIIVLVIFLSSLFVLKTYDLNENFGTKVLAVYTALFTPCIPLQQTSRFHLYNSLLSQCEEESNKTGLGDSFGPKIVTGSEYCQVEFWAQYLMIGTKTGFYIDSSNFCH